MTNALLKKQYRNENPRVLGTGQLTATSRREGLYVQRPPLVHKQILHPQMNVPPVQSVRITASALNIRKGPGTNYKIIGQFKRGMLIDYLAEEGDWLKINYFNQTAYIARQYTEKIDSTPQTREYSLTKPLQAIALARKYLGCTTKDLLGKLKYLKDLSKNPGTNHGYNLNCANFVSAILNEVGLIDKHVVGCSKLREVCLSCGYQVIPKSQAKPGDVWINSHHTELVESISNDIITLIGSNNNGDKIQEITLDSRSAQKDGEIYRNRL